MLNGVQVILYSIFWQYLNLRYISPPPQPSLLRLSSLIEFMKFLQMLVKLSTLCYLYGILLSYIVYFIYTDQIVCSLNYNYKNAAYRCLILNSKDYSEMSHARGICISVVVQKHPCSICNFTFPGPYTASGNTL